jgi:hypothetical protein
MVDAPQVPVRRELIYSRRTYRVDLIAVFSKGSNLLTQKIGQRFWNCRYECDAHLPLWIKYSRWWGLKVYVNLAILFCTPSARTIGLSAPPAALQPWIEARRYM